jgi:hypothetical protein
MRVAALQQDVGFRAYDEEGRAERETVEALEIEVSAIHDAESPRLRQELVEDVDVVHFAVGDADKRGDVAVQIQQRVHLDGGLVLAEPGPRKQRQAEIDGGRIQRVEALRQIDTDWIAGVERSRDADQELREVGIDAPVAGVVGVSQRGGCAT